MEIVICEQCEKELNSFDLRMQPMLKGICLDCGYENGWEGLTHAEKVRCSDLLNYLRMTPDQRRAFDKNLGS